jgi:HK97 family phage portal protein
MSVRSSWTWRDLFFHKTERPPVETKSGSLERIGVQGRAPALPTDASSLIAAYGRSELAFACIAVKRKAMQDPRLIVERKQADGTWKEDPGHPLRRLIMRPNDQMDEAAFIGSAVASMDIAGRFYAEKVFGTYDAIVGLIPLNPACVTKKHKPNGDVFYRWKEGNEQVDYEPEELLIREEPSWYSPAPLAVALGATDSDRAQTEFVRAFFNNGGQPSGILKVKGTYSQEKADALSTKWAAKYGRSGDGWGRPAVLDDNADYQQTGAKLNELASESLVSIFESRICMAFGVPPLIIYAYVGLLRATYSNLKEAWSSFWDAELSPALKAWATWLTWSLLVEFEGEERVYSEQVRLNWDLSQVASLQDDVNVAQTRARAHFQAGALTLNEFRAAVGQLPDPAGDYYLRGLTLAPEPAGVAPDTTAGDVLSGKQDRRNHAIKALKVASTDRIERRLQKQLVAYLQDEYERAADAVEV